MLNFSQKSLYYLFRCIVKIVEGEGINFCDQQKCSENRRFAIRNKMQFECSHIDKVLNAVEHDAITPMYVLC